MATIKVKVYAPGFCDHTWIDDQGFVELPVLSTLKDLYSIIKMPLLRRRLMIVRVNYDKVKIKHHLKDGDTISIFLPLSGG